MTVTYLGCERLKGCPFWFPSSALNGSVAILTYQSQMYIRKKICLQHHGEVLFPQRQANEKKIYMPRHTGWLFCSFNDCIASSFDQWTSFLFTGLGPWATANGHWLLLCKPQIKVQTRATDKDWVESTRCFFTVFLSQALILGAQFLVRQELGILLCGTVESWARHTGHGRWDGNRSTFVGL